MKRLQKITAVSILTTVAAALPLMAEEAPTPQHLGDSINTVWTLIAAFMVFFMQAGFAMVESGFTRAKNAANIMMKNLMDFSLGSLAYWAVGFAIMFGVSASGIFGTSGFFLSDGIPGDNDWSFAFFIFQTVFAATAATIVSGAMAERTKFTSYLIYSVAITALVYPLFGHWAWGSLFGKGEGWLESMGFVDFAGSTVVHSIGGWAALAGAIILGPRTGKYAADGTPKAIMGHNLPIAALGVFILWFGWFGFNPGSTTAGTDLSIGRIAVTTNLAAAAGAVAAMITAWIVIGKPELSMALNGVLAGLVGITAGCASVSPLSAVIIGLIAGVVVVLSVLFIDRVLKIDDPVGAVSVHGVCGAVGTIAVGLFAQEAYSGGPVGLFFGGGVSLLFTQVIGAVTAFVFSLGTCLIIFSIIKATVGLRVSVEEEVQGLDINEHGNEAYAGFQVFTTEEVAIPRPVSHKKVAAAMERIV